MSDDDSTSWKGYVVGGGVLLAFTGILFGAFHLRVLYSSPDTIEGSAIVSEHEVIALEHVHGGEGETSLPGGKRLVRLEARTGTVLARTRCDHESFLGVFGSAAWLARDDKTLVRRNLASLAVDGTDAPGAASNLCVDLPTESVRFTSKDGRHLAFSLRTRTTSPVDNASCAQRDTTRLEAELSGMIVTVKPLTGTSRLGLFDERTPLDVSGLEMRLLVDPRSPLSNPMYRGLSIDMDGLLLRRVTLDTEDYELLRFDPRAKKELWSARLGGVGSNPAAVFVTPGALLYQDGRQLLAMDPRTGTRLWHRGN